MKNVIDFFSFLFISSNMLFMVLVNFNNPGVTVLSVIVLLTMMLGESKSTF